jgi:hypothetical protein
MHPLPGRLFLLVLLLCDWCGDPYYGHNPMSRPLGSQEVFCYSIGCKEEVNKDLAPLGSTQPTEQGVNDCVALCHGPSFRPEVPPPDTGRLYVFKELRC